MITHIVMTSSAHMPTTCWGRYANVAVVKCNTDNPPKQIHPKHKKVLDIVSYEGKLFVGRTDRCAFARALSRANELAETLNGGLTVPTR